MDFTEYIVMLPFLFMHLGLITPSYRHTDNFIYRHARGTISPKKHEPLTYALTHQCKYK